MGQRPRQDRAVFEIIMVSLPPSSDVHEIAKLTVAALRAHGSKPQEVALAMMVGLGYTIALSEGSVGKTAEQYFEDHLEHFRMCFVAGFRCVS